MSNIWYLLNIDGLTIDTGFGLEYYLLGNIDKAKPLLSKGIQFCDMIQKGNLTITQEEITSSDLDAWEDIQILIKCKNPDQFKAIVEEAILIKIDLMKMVNSSNMLSYSEEKIRKMQEFFIDTGKPYLNRAYNLMRRRERCLHFYNYVDKRLLGDKKERIEIRDNNQR